jgi:UDP-N-acetylglucosamine diphosphorylase/glucosamine-1-phosphate N-acetyltransferase
MQAQLGKNGNNRCAVVILAAGLGTRMKSQKAKVLHEIMGTPMVLYVVETARKAVGEQVILVIGHQAETVKAVVSARDPKAAYAIQEKQLGTGHAVMCAMPLLGEDVENVVILCGDVPLLRHTTVESLISEHCRSGRDLTVLAVAVEKPTGYGRIIYDENHNLLKIVEEADATDEQKRLATINTGIYCVGRRFLAEALQHLTTDNAQGEFYLTDIIEIGYREGKSLGVLLSAHAEEAIGVNSSEELAAVERILQRTRTEKS